MFHADLLEQAAHLARKEPTRPKQASLRRAVSTAYYALFHRLVHDSSRFLIAGRQRGALRAHLARSFDHRRMREAATEVSRSQRKPCRAILGQMPPDELVEVAKFFVDLQLARHGADYDLSKPLERSKVLGHIRRAEAATRAWEQIRTTREAEAFMVACLIPFRRS